jgi:hypothetical protein
MKESERERKKSIKESQILSTKHASSPKMNDYEAFWSMTTMTTMRGLL